LLKFFRHASDSTAQHFRQHARAYNSSLCMASTGPLLQLCWWCCVSPGWPHFVGVCPLLQRRVCPLAVRSAR
jgi:hypothetical protein